MFSNFESLSLANIPWKCILAIESLPVLEKLNLNGNQFGDEGCETLISQMDTSGIGHKLDSLDEDNEPDDDEEDEESLWKNFDNIRQIYYIWVYNTVYYSTLFIF